MSEVKWDIQLSVTETNNVGSIKPRQNNVNSEKVRAQILNKQGKPYDLTALAVYFAVNFKITGELNNPNQKAATVIDAKNGVIEYTFDNDVMQQVGRQEGYFEILNHGEFVDATQVFSYTVQSSARKVKGDFAPYIATWEEMEVKLGDNPAFNLQEQIDNHELVKADKREVANDLSKKADNTTLVEITTDMQKQIDNTQAGFVGDFNSEIELNTTYPKGAKGYATATVNGVSTKFIWANATWENRGPFNGMGIPNESISAGKIAPKALGPAQIADGAISNILLRDGAVTESKIGDLNIGSAKLKEGAATSSKRTTLGELATISTNGIMNIDTTKKTMTMINGSGNIVYRNKFFSTNLKDKEISIGSSDSNSSFIYVDTITGDIKFAPITTMPENSLFLGFCHWDTKTFHFNFPFLVDGYEYRKGKKEVSGTLSFIVANEPLILDYQNKTLTFPNSTSLGLNTFNITKALPNARGQVLDLNINSGGQGYVVFNEVTGKFEFKILSSNLELEKNVITIGYIFCSSKTKFLTAETKVLSELSNQSRHENKNSTVVGDSNVWGDIDGNGSGGNQYSWVSYLADLCGFISVTNLGIKGSMITSRGTGGSIVERCASIVNQDVVVIKGGINDFNNHMPLGTFLSTDITTFYGALRVMFSTIIKNNPDATLLMITPMKETKFVSTYDADFNLNKNSAGFTQLDYVNAIKKVAEIYSVNILDLYNEAPFTPIIEEQKEIYMPDGLHFSILGNRKLAYTIAQKINNL